MDHALRVSRENGNSSATMSILACGLIIMAMSSFWVKSCSLNLLSGAGTWRYGFVLCLRGSFLSAGRKLCFPSWLTCQRWGSGNQSTLEEAGSSRLLQKVRGPCSTCEVLDWIFQNALKGFLDFSVKSLAIVQDGTGSYFLVGKRPHNSGCASACDLRWMI